MSSGQHGVGEDLDTLREVANVAAAHAATALSQLTGRRVMITVPDLLLVPLATVPESLTGYTHDVQSVEMRTLGRLRGRMLYLMTPTEARLLADILLGCASLDQTLPEGIARSCLQETGNIMGGAYAGALARMTGYDVMLSVPRLVAGELLDLVSVGSMAGDVAFCIQNRFQFGASDAQLGGHLLLVSDPDSLSAMIEAARAIASAV